MYQSKIFLTLEVIINFSNLTNLFTSNKKRAILFRVRELVWNAPKIKDSTDAQSVNH